jgi:hypothetical protein
MIDCAYYVDSETDVVSDETIEYIYYAYECELYDYAMNYIIGQAEAYYERDR